jgi:hypothetical protein
MRTVKTIVYAISLSVLIACDPTPEKVEKPKEKPIEQYKLKANQAKDFCARNHLNTDFFILIDLNRHSGLKRFYVWDFHQKQIKESYLVSHGCGNSTYASDKTKEKPSFSNENDSHCSSIGKFIIGERGVSDWGINVKYLLHGQDATNNNATKRAIVFHSWEKITDEEIYPKGTIEGWGCPAISNRAMIQMDKLIQHSNKKVLMWII